MPLHGQDLPRPLSDFLVIGSGIAGLSLALQLASHGTVTLLTKKGRADSNTNYAQGGIAAVLSPEDRFDLHVQDTLVAGDGLCDQEVVRQIVESGPRCIDVLLKLGILFTKSHEGKGKKRAWDLGKEGGHSMRRVIHSGDITGRAIERALVATASAHRNIRLLENHIAIDLITTAKLGLTGANRCVGAYALDSTKGTVKTFMARATVLASGGCGKVYLYTTNPDIATGDGVAIAYRAGARVANMEFVQFHPTCLYHPEAKSFLISEAVRGEGAFLVRQDGTRFMPQCDARAELAPRDIVARAIDAEMKRSGADCVFLDIRHKGEAFIRERFPNIHATCLKYGIDMAHDPVPVVPAAHYQCGGVIAGVDGRTDIGALFCIGEVACTGLHGANRLASNSLLEAVAMASACAQACAQAPSLPRLKVPKWESGEASEPDELVVVSHNWDEVRRLMWDYVGIVRTTKRLQRAASRLRNLDREIQEFYWNFRVTADLLELRNLVKVAQLIVESAMRRRESRGLHYSLDFPSHLPGPPANTILCREEPKISFEETTPHPGT